MLYYSNEQGTKVPLATAPEKHSSGSSGWSSSGDKDTEAGPAASTESLKKALAGLSRQEKKYKVLNSCTIWRDDAVGIPENQFF